LNAPTKGQRLAEWIQEQDPYICCLQETHLKTKDTYRLKAKGWKKIFHANGDQKKAGVAILISNKIDFKMKAVKRDKEGHHIVIKKDAWNDFNFFKFTKARFMAQDVIYPGKGSVCT